jgi:hypothetical protein
VVDLICREIAVIFQRDWSRDSTRSGIEVTGYEVFWPDGRRIGMTLEGLCKIGVRYLFGRHPPERAEVRLRLFDLPSRETPPPRVRPYRVRVLALQRNGRRLTLHLPDETPTNIVFDLDRDEPRVLEWLGADAIADGGRQWIGLLAVPADVPVPPTA